MLRVRKKNLIVLLIGLLFWTSAYCQTDPQDRSALEDLYNSANGSGWTNKLNWLTVNDPSTWYGVTVSSNRVISIDLSGNSLSGIIPASFVNLNNLQQLNLSNNNLSGTIPSFSNFLQLTLLDLSVNQFSGTLPATLLGLDGLTEINLSHNQINGTVGSAIAGMVNIQMLDLSFNQLSGQLPDELYTLANLSELRLNDNLFSGEILKRVNNFINLQVLHLQHNHLDGRIPGQLDQLSLLNDLNLSFNWFIRMDNLTNFYPNATITVDVKNNRLQFDDLESNLGLDNFTFTPQDSVNSNKLITRFETEDFFVKTNIRGGINNSYVWFKDGAPIAGETNFDLSRPGVTAADQGIYYCEAINANVTGLTLRTRTITLKVKPCGSVIDPQDEQALIALYNSTGGPNWTNHLNWLVGDPGTWFGVTVQCGRVKFLELPNNNLTGSIPPEIGNLTSLLILQLSTNHLTGVIPSSIGKLRNLDKLLLYENQLTGPLPPELGKLTMMTLLYLNTNKITGPLPEEIGSLNDNLRGLQMWDNKLTGSLNMLTRLDAATNIYLNDNQLTGHLPEAITDLTNLMVIDVARNKLSGTVPQGLDKLVNLFELSLGSNQFTGTIPPAIALLPNFLSFLDLSNNQLTGTIPSNLSGLTGLKTLGFAHNQLTGLLPDLTSCTLLEDLNVEDNQLAEDFGVFLINVGHPTSFKSINIGFNQFFGSPAATIGLFTNLTFFSAAQNFLTGVLTSVMGNLDELLLFDISRNQFSGPLPPELGNMKKISVLQLWSNQFDGSIPVELQLATTLTALGLDENQLTGSIPIELGNLPNLQALGLNSNQLMGTIPTQLGNLSNLVFLRVDDNLLTGSIPVELSALSNLDYLNVGLNQLTGGLPKELSLLTNLKQFHAYDNQFTGNLPKEYASLTKLEALQIKNNSFTGAVPPEYLAWTKLQYLLLYNNNFTSVPDFSANPLIAVKLEDNELTFESIEPYFANPPADFTYSPQGDVGVITNSVIRGGCPYTANANVGGSQNSYQWYKDGVILPGVTNATVPFAAIAIPDAGAYNCQVTNSIVTGLTITTRPITISVLPTINTSLAEDPANQLCNAKKLIASPAGLFAYQWYVDGKKIIGATLNTYDSYYDGSYTVTYQPDATSCSLVTPALGVIGLYADATPSISNSGNPVTKLTTTYSAPSYQWYVNDRVIANGTSADLNIWYNGSYYMMASLANGCRYKSNTILVNESKYTSLVRLGTPADTTALENPEETIILFPNPAQDMVTLENGPLKITGIEFYDNTLKSVFKKEFESIPDQVQVDVSSWSAGIYLVLIQSDEKRIWRKLVKY